MNPATRWAEIFVQGLAAAGIDTVCIAPGSRSTPLTAAFSAHPDFRVFSHLDERSAAFFALGRALVTGKPTPIVCTSGTAAANFFPAVIEASTSQVPMLILTADRPPELRHTGANQTIDQIKLFGEYVRWFVDMPLPETTADARTLRSLSSTAARAVARSMDSPPGPVHLNFPFRKPLEPNHPAQSYPIHTPVILANPRDPSTEQIEFTAELVRQYPNGLIFCGPRPAASPDFPQAVAALSRATGFPLVADVLSDLRFGPHTRHAPPHNPAILPHLPASDLVIQFGGAPVSKAALTFFEQTPAKRIAVHPHGTFWDEHHQLDGMIAAEPTAFCDGVNAALTGRHIPDNSVINSAAARAEAEYWGAVDVIAAQIEFEGLLLANAAALMPPNSQLFVANSLPIRHLDAYARPHANPLSIFANRGVSGIDGTVSSALGAASGSKQPTALITGDLSFYHDMNGLLAVHRGGVPITIVVINNNGGGIFRRLPIAQHDPPFTDLFLTPHGLTFAPAAEMYGLRYVHVNTSNDFANAFRDAVGNVPTLIEVTTDSTVDENARRQIAAAFAQSRAQS